MAVQMLDNRIAYGLGKHTTLTQPATRHDLEALAWVVIYCLYRKAHSRSALSNDLASAKALEEAFRGMFGEVTASKIAERRVLALSQIDIRLTTLDPVTPLKPFIEPELLILARVLLIMVKDQNRTPSTDLDSRKVKKLLFKFSPEGTVPDSELPPDEMTCPRLLASLKQQLADITE